MRINKIKKMSGNKYKIFFDDSELITYDNVILENDLLYKKNIDTILYNKIVLDTNYYDVYNKTVKYILKRRRSEKDVVNYLNKLCIEDYKINSIITKLKEINLINDLEFCKAYINDKVHLSGEGINKIKNDLLKEDISIDIINEEIKNIDKSCITEKLEKIILKKIKTNNKYSNNYLKKKILNDMINLGYAKEDILLILQNNLKDDNEILKREFNKIYDKLSKKYSGIELNNRVKQKLILKGFQVEDINQLLQ